MGRRGLFGHRRSVREDCRGLAGRGHVSSPSSHLPPPGAGSGRRQLSPSSTSPSTATSLSPSSSAPWSWAWWPGRSLLCQVPQHTRGRDRTGRGSSPCWASRAWWVRPGGWPSSRPWAGPPSMSLRSSTPCKVRLLGQGGDGLPHLRGGVLVDGKKQDSTQPGSNQGHWFQISRAVPRTPGREGWYEGQEKSPKPKQILSLSLLWSCVYSLTFFSLWTLLPSLRWPLPTQAPKWLLPFDMTFSSWGGWSDSAWSMFLGESRIGSGHRGQGVHLWSNQL